MRRTASTYHMGRPDHVYSAAPWGLRDSNLAYSIGRIMEFLPEMADSCTRKPTSTPERVRVAWYYRPSDLSERSTDSRLLLAAMYSEVQPVSYIRGKCYVRHRDLIANLPAWKKQPDCFYFYRFFDPYIKKEYEVLLSRNVNNREFLRVRFLCCWLNYVQFLPMLKPPLWTDTSSL